MSAPKVERWEPIGILNASLLSRPVPKEFVPGDQHDATVSALASAIKERDEAYARVEVLEQYVEHHEGCPHRTHPFIQSCTCGLSDALAPELAKEPS